jgi:hypothetical protein
MVHKRRLRGRQVFDIYLMLIRNIWPGYPKEPRPDERKMDRIGCHHTSILVAGKKIIA